MFATTCIITYINVMTGVYKCIGQNKKLIIQAFTVIDVYPPFGCSLCKDPRTVLTKTVNVDTLLKCVNVRKE